MGARCRKLVGIDVVVAWNTVMVGGPDHVTAGGGAIVLTSSDAGTKMQPRMAHSTASSHAVTGMTRGFAAEPGKHRIRVGSVHPGAGDAPMAPAT